MTGRPRHGLVLGKFYPPHAGHQLLFDTALQGCEQLTVLVAGATVESLPLHLRHRWVAEMAPQARVVSCRDDVPIDFGDPAIWDAHMEIFAAAVGAPVDVVFTSERYGAELARRFGAREVLVDLDRTRVPVSSRAIRADPVAHWHHLPPAVRAHLAKRVVVLGAESTGTTTLSRALAAELGAGWVGEYGRELSEHKATAGTFDTWTAEEFAAIYLRQSRAEEEQARAGGPVVVCDTDPLATLVWEERYLGATSAEGRHFVAHRPPPALYLLTHHDGVPFAQDGLRDGEHLRPWMTARFEEELAAQPVPWRMLRGTPEQRLAGALAAVEELLRDGWHFAPPLG